MEHLHTQNWEECLVHINSNQVKKHSLLDNVNIVYITFNSECKGPCFL